VYGSREDVSLADLQGSRCKKSKDYSCALLQVTTELPEVSSDETRYSLVLAEQSRVERQDMSVVADGVNKSIFFLLRSMFAV